MKKVIKLIALLTILLSFFSFVAAKEVYTINNHDYKAIVNQDGTIDIIETITVSFNEKRHGIIISLPTTYQKNWQIEDQTVFRQYYFPITNVKVLSNQKNKVEYLDNSVRIIFGDQDIYSNKQEVYMYRYRLVTRDLNLDGLQMVFLNIVTSGWDATHENCDFSIQFPKDFSDDNIQTVFPDDNGELIVNHQNNTITGHYNGIIAQDEGISILVDLGHDYFQFPDFNMLARNICLAIIILVLTSFVVYLFVGKDEKIKAENKVELSDDLDSSLVGLLIDEQMNEKDLLSLILYWANKGYIKITDLIDDVQFEKIKQLEEDKYRYQRLLFKTLFSKGKTVKLSQIKNQLANTIESIIEEVNLNYLRSKDKLSTNSSIIMQYIMIFTSFLITGSFVCLLYYEYFFLLKNTMLIMLIEFAVITIISYLFSLLYRKRLQLRIVKQIICYVVLLLLLIANQFFVYYLLKQVSIDYYYFVAVFILQISFITIMMVMRKRNKSYNELFQKIINIREVIINGNINRENDKLIEELLPYSFALGLSNQLMASFQQQPDIHNDSDIVNNYSYIMALLLSFAATNQSVVKNEYTLSSNANCTNANTNDIDIDSGFGGSSGTSW